MKNPFINSMFKIVGNILIGIVLLPVAAHAATTTLGSYAVDESQTSVSGLSSGAFMATQFHVAYSSTVIGAGIIAGGPYYCAKSNMLTALSTCMSTPLNVGPDAASLLLLAQGFAQLNLIDNLSNLQKSKVYVFSGTNDDTVHSLVVAQTAAFYRQVGIPDNHISYVNNIPAGHAIITANTKNTKCAITVSPFINDCDFVQSQKILNYIYDDLKPAATTLSGKIIKFNQLEFINVPYSSMGDEAYAYVPQSCETQTCKVHVAFHGCEQGAADIGNKFYNTTGYNQLADTNNIIVLYPQVQKSYGLFLTAFNPKGCWDFWGYSSPSYYTREGTQMAAVKKMLDRLAQPRVIK